MTNIADIVPSISSFLAQMYYLAYRIYKNHYNDDTNLQVCLYEISIIAKETTEVS